MNTSRASSRTFRVALGLAAFSTLFLATTLWAAPRDRSFSETFPISDNSTLRLANLAGRMHLEEGGGTQVRVDTTVYAEGRNAAQTEELLAGMKWVSGKDRKGREVWSLSYPVGDYRGFHYPAREKDGDEDSIWWKILNSFNLSQTSSHYRGEKVTLYGSRSSSVPTLFAEVTIYILPGTRLAVRNVVGDVDGGEASGDLEVDTGSGSVDLAGFAGNLSVDTGSGSVRIGWARGETDVDTGSGSIRIGSLVGNGNFDTGSGSIRVLKVSAGRLIADTGSGSIEIADGTVGNLEADTGSGSIRVLGVEIETFVGDTGSGSVLLESSLATAREVLIDTGSGSVKIHAGADASFDLDTSLGSGRLVVRYDDAILRKRGPRVVGAKRGDGQTRIHVDTGSGGCTIGPIG